MLDLVIRNARIYDGSGQPSYRGEVGVRNGRIVSVGRVPETGAQDIDAHGLAVAARQDLPAVAGEREAGHRAVVALQAVQFAGPGRLRGRGPLTGDGGQLRQAVEEHLARRIGHADRDRRIGRRVSGVRPLDQPGRAVMVTPLPAVFSMRYVNGPPSGSDT